jgi:hypothetical protein
VVDIVRLENGQLAEHWDVIQDEVTTANVVSETTNCNSCHPGHCGRSDVHSLGMGGRRFNCKAPRARYAAGRKTLSLKDPHWQPNA